MDNAVSPSVAVVIPAFLCAESIGQVLDALFNQSVPPQQIVVVNDASPDRLADVLASYSDRITVITNATNMGLAKSYNVGLRQVTADYAMTLHSDCILAPDYIRNMVQILESDIAIAVATGQYRFPNIDRMSFADRLYLALNLLPRQAEDDAGPPRRIPFIEGKADLFRMAYLREVNFFDERFVLTSEDQDMSARLRLNGWSLIQDPASGFTSAFGGTQNSVAKVIRKQRTYARGQAFITLKYGIKSVSASTANRNARAIHRVLQLLFTLAGGLLVGVICWNPTWIMAGIGLLAFRYLLYLGICAWLGWSQMWGGATLGVWSDVWYSVGFAEGVLKVMFLGRT